MATPYSSPDLYFRLQPVESHNWELAGQVLMAKQQKYDANLAQIENLVQQYVGLDIANKDAKNHLYNNLKTLTSEVDRIASTEDLSNSNATKNITSYIGQAIDTTTINAVNTTRMKRQYDATWDEIRNKKPELYNNINKAFGESGWGDYVNADKDADVSQYVKHGFAVIPYVDIKGMTDKTMMEYMKLAKDREYSVPIQVQKGVDDKGNPIYETVGFKEYVETGLNPAVVRNMMQAQLTPEVKQQMAINAWSNYGEFKGEGAINLKKDYTNYMDSMIEDAENSISKMELKLTEYGKGSDEEKKIKKDLSDYRTEIGGLKDRKVSTLASIDNGNFMNAGLEIESGRFVKQGVGIFGSFYNTYSKGTKANEIFWKQMDLEQRQYEFSENLKLRKAEYDLSVDDLEFRKEKALKDEQAFLNTGVTYGAPKQDQEGIAKSSESENVQNVLDLKKASNNITNDWVKTIDDVIKQEDDSVVKTSAVALRDVYAKELGLKKGTYENKSITDLRNSYDKYNAKLNKILIEDVGVSSPLSSLNTPNGGNRAQALTEANSRYKTAYSSINKIRTDERNAVFTDDVVKEVLSSKNDAVVMVNRGGKMVVEKAKDAFKPYINADGSWKSSTTQAQKDAIKSRIQETETVQKVGLLIKKDGNIIGETGLVTSIIRDAGFSEDDFDLIIQPSVGAYKAIPKKGTEAYRLLNYVTTLDKASKGRLDNNNWFGENTNIARDSVFSDKIEANRKSARQQAIERHDKIRNSRTAEVMETTVASKLANGKPNPMFSEVANKLNSEKGEFISFEAGNTISALPNADGSYTFRATVKSTKKGEENRTVTMNLSAEEVARSMPTFYSQTTAGSKPAMPIHTYEKIGTKKKKVANLSYFGDTEYQQALNITGNPNTAFAMTPNGAINMIQSVDPIAYQGLSNVFENFGQKIKEKVSNMNGKYDLSYGFSSDMNSAEVTLMTKDGKPIFTINKALDANGSMDSTIKDVEYTPALVINQMISELISLNYYRTNGDYDNSAWKLLMGDMKRK